MRKTAIAIALAAASFTAQAQNVAIDGQVTTSIQRFDNGAGTVTRMQDGAWGPSRIGFHGSEDLGSGLKLRFRLEGQMNLSAGTQGATTPVTNEVFNREAWVGFQGSFGELQLGRSDTSWAQQLESWVSRAGDYGLRPINGTSVELGSDVKNVVRYTTPKLGGFIFDVGHTTNANGASTDAGTSQNAASVRYEQGKLRLGAGWSRQDGATSVAERHFTQVVAGYDFGALAVGVSHAWGDPSTTADLKAKSTIATASVPLANDVTLHGAYGQADDPAQATANQGKGYAFGASKMLSKRTRLFAMYSAVDNQANSSMYMAALSAPAAAGGDTSAYAVGIVHQF